LAPGAGEALGAEAGRLGGGDEDGGGGAGRGAGLGETLGAIEWGVLST